MNKEWIDFVHKEKEKEDVQIISEELPETGGRRRTTSGNSKKGY
jgi:hypothetical protein